MKYEIKTDGDNKIFDIQKTEKAYKITTESGTLLVQRTLNAVPDTLSCIIDGKSVDAGITRHKDYIEVEIDGERHLVAVLDPRKKALRLSDGADEGLLVSRMPGRIVQVCVEVGQEVQKGDILVIVEAMKMENPIKALKTGVVSAVYVRQGDLVEARQSLVLVE